MLGAPEARASSMPDLVGAALAREPVALELEPTRSMSYAAILTSALPGSGRPIEPGLAPLTLTRIAPASVDA